MATPVVSSTLWSVSQLRPYASRHQVGEWIRHGIIQAPVIKTGRRGAPGYTFDAVEVAMLGVMARLRGAGLRLDSLAAIAPAVRRWYRDNGDREGYLVTTRSRVWMEGSRARVAEIAVGMAAAVWMVDLRSEWQRASELPAAATARPICS